VIYVCPVVGGTVTEHPPSAAPSTTIPGMRILLIPRPCTIQVQPEGECKGGATQNQFASTLTGRCTIPCA
jgi:hypothetical protein